jgi:hypothetical protein
MDRRFLEGRSLTGTLRIFLHIFSIARVTPPVERQNSKPFFYLTALLGTREQTTLYRLVLLTCRATSPCDRNDTVLFI